jgi:hypothetical protein
MPKDLDVPDSATPEEAAAIAAAVEAYREGQRNARNGDDSTGSDGAEGDDGWNGDRWRFRGRIEALQSRSVRVPEGAPADPWRAAGRSDRF